MKYRRLGKTDLNVSVIGIGTWQFGGEWGKTFEAKEVGEMLAQARDQGINLIDTAECYGDHLSESLIGESLPGKRQEWIIASKFGHHFHEAFERTRVYDPDDVVRQLDASLAALQTDYLDLYQFHSGSNEDFQTEQLWETLAEQQAAGKIRHLGVSLGGDPVVHGFQTTRASEVGASAIQVIYNRLDRRPEELVFPCCQEQDLGVLARVPLASGYLSGKYQPGDRFPANDVREKWMAEGRDQKLAQAQAIISEEVPADIPPAQWALAWCLQHDAVSCVIPGCKNLEQVRSNAAVADLEMVSPLHPQSLA